MTHMKNAIAMLTLTAGLALPAMAEDGPSLSDRVLQASLKQVFPNGAGPQGGSPDAGPDVIVGELHSSQSSNGSMNVTIATSSSTATHVAYGIGTTSCNVGTVNLNWISNTPNHPIIPQNLYRVTTGTNSRIVQLGQSWCKFAFTALTFNACSNEGFTCNGAGGAVLGVGCSDPYTASRNATQSTLGPRFTANPFTGAFPDGNSAWRTANWVPAVSSGMDRRLRVAKADIDAGGLFFTEAAYLTPDDAAAGNGKNNTSYRRTTIAAGTYTMTLTDSTVRRQPAIYAWKAHGLGLNTPDNSITISEVNALGGTPADGWLVIASKATQINATTWHYEYAMENLNSDRMGGSLTIPIAAGTNISNAVWRGVDSHSGFPAEDATRNEAWRVVIGATSVSCQALTPYNAGTPTLGNGLRWATMYNFSFDCNKPPVAGQATLGFYKPGTPASVSGAAWVPDPAVTGSTCYANCDGSTIVPFLNVNDFTCFTNLFAAGSSLANCDGSSTIPVLNVNDFTCFLNSFAAGCSAP
ncbi:MAG: GC-type dockerin domain-anchored protein [Phycisphaerales bacterium]